jgi:lipoprotein-anchoring transpeptidase ErfK/SrfK
VACVDLAAHVSWLQQDGRVIFGPVPALGGAGRERTPRGIFHVAYKVLHSYSTEFHEPMPFAVYFATGGIAFHEGSLTKASHGCVHLGARAAARYFAGLSVGAEVDVF